MGFGSGTAKAWDPWLAEHEEGCRQCVRFGGRREHNRCQQGCGDWFAGSRVDDVTAGTALMDEVFGPPCGDAQRGVLKFHDVEDIGCGGRGAGLRGMGAGDGNPPSRSVRGAAEGGDTAGPAVKEGGLDSGFAEAVQRAIEGVAFADGAEVEHHAGPGEADGSSGGIEFDPLHADGLQGFSERLRVGGMPGAVQESPAIEQRCDRWIEGPLGQAAEVARLFEEAEDGRRYADGLAMGMAVDAVDLASGPVKAELIFKVFDFVEGRLTGSAEGDGIGAVQEHLESGVHGAAGEGDGLEGHGAGRE